MYLNAHGSQNMSSEDAFEYIWFFFFFLLVFFPSVLLGE